MNAIAQTRSPLSPRRAMGLYYAIKWLIPRRLQVSIRSFSARRRRARVSSLWPILPAAGKRPLDFRWPLGRKFALVLTHDVDTAVGYENCARLLALETRLGFRSSFNFVPEGYPVAKRLRMIIEFQGFEVGVHGLRHDGKLYRSRKIFHETAERINRYLMDWGSVGFRSPSMHHELEWLHDLNIQYDSSTFDTDPFEPQPDGAGTIFPFFVPSLSGGSGYVEMPYTIPQDFTVFMLLKEKNIQIWKAKLDWIAANGGMALLNTHPDYMSFGRKRSFGCSQYPAELYEEFLLDVTKRYAGTYWQALPREMAIFWRRLITADS